MLFMLFVLSIFISARGVLKTVNGKYPPMLRCYPVTEVFGETEEEVFEPLKLYAAHDLENT
jgi:hypothetical protein